MSKRNIVRGLKELSRERDHYPLWQRIAAWLIAIFVIIALLKGMGVL